MKTSLLGIYLIAVAAVSSLAYGQSIQPAWTYSYDEATAGKQILYFTPLNSGSDGSVAFVATRSDGAGGNLENKIFWLRANADGTSPSAPLWSSAWIASSGYTDVVAVRINHLVYAIGRELKSVTVDAGGIPTETTVKVFSGSEEGGDPLVFTVEAARAPGFVYSIAPQLDKQGFTFSAFKFTPAIPSVSEVATISSILGNSLSIKFRSQLGVNYRVQRSTDLETWTDDGGVIAGDGTMLEVLRSMNVPRLFFRIVAL